MAKAEKEKHVLDDQPLNAEEPVNKLVDSFITPSSKLFDRNHGEVPQIDAATHRVYFEAEDDLGLEGFSLGMPDLYRAGNSEVIAALQCAGNRRSEMAGLSGLGETEGLPWGSGTVGNSRWSGALLRPYLIKMGIGSQSELKDCHIEFISNQKVQEASYYASSIPLKDALDESLPILLCTHMNGELLSAKHGGPLRATIPGKIGARSVKWLNRIRIRKDESSNFYQQQDYKVLPIGTTKEEKSKAMAETPALQNYGINSVIASPSASSTLPGRTFTAKGYAISDGKSAVSKVQVILLSYESAEEDLIEKADQSDDWQEARLEGAEHRFAWTLWEIELSVPQQLKSGQQVAVISRAVCQDGSVQDKRNDWNLRGVDMTQWPVVADLTVP